MDDEEETLLHCVECEEEAASLTDEGLCPDCVEPTVKKVHRLALDSLVRWDAFVKQCGQYRDADHAMKEGEEATRQYAEMTNIEHQLEDAIGEDGDDYYVFAHGDDAVILVGSGEDGVYVVERPLLRMDR